MNGIRKCAIGFSVLSCLMLTILHGLDSSEKLKIKGLIAGRTADALIVKTADSSVTLVLTDDTKVQKPKGLGLRKTRPLHYRLRIYKACIQFTCEILIVLPVHFQSNRLKS